jgi:zinc protease
MGSGGVVRAMALVKPQDVPLFQATARQIAADLIAKPPSADEIARVTEPLRQMVTRAYSGSALFMFQLEGATRDPQRFAALRTLLGDYTETTPETMQALAARYLAPDKAWDIAVLPEGPAGTVAAR